MANFWIDIEDGGGVKQGGGPITTATSWTSTRRLDRSGTFTFTVPAADDRTDLIRAKRVARCWTYDGTLLQSVGAGIIDTITINAGADGAPTMTVSGDDLLRQLTYRSVGELQLYEANSYHPAILFRTLDGVRASFDDEATYTSMANAYDLTISDATTEELFYLGDTSGLLGQDIIYIKYPTAFHGVTFVVTEDNSQDITVTWEYWNPTSSNWESLSITDGTDTGSAPFAQSGTVSWSIPSEWAPASGEPNYKVRFYSSSGETDQIGLGDIVVVVNEPVTEPITAIMAYAPDGWAMDAVNGYADITSATELGDNLLSNASFETLTGSGTPDNFASWTEVTAGSEDIQQAGSAQSGDFCVQFDSAADGNNPIVYQNVACDALTDYRVTYWAKGDGTRQAALRISTSQDAGANYYNITAPEDSGVTGTTWTQVTRDFTTPTSADYIRVNMYGPYLLYVGSAYVDNVTLKRRIGGQVMTEFINESVLAALVSVAEQTGEHFTLSPNGKEVLWFRADAPDSGVRAIGGVDGFAARDNNKVCLISDFAEMHNAYELASRVYPFGGGFGSDRITLADCTRSAPTGYTLDKTNNYLSRTAAATALGRIDRMMNWSDINALSEVDSHRQFAANQLFDRAYAWLQEHSATNTNRKTVDPVIVYDTFTRGDGASVGSSETTGPSGEGISAYVYTEDKWSISSNQLINTPDLGADLIVTGNFSADTDWTKGTGWSIAAGVGTHAAGTAAAIVQDVLTANTWYRCDWTITSYTAGYLAAQFGAGIASCYRNEAATFYDTYRAEDVQAGIYATAAGAGSIDNVSFKALTLSDLLCTVSSRTTEVSIDITCLGFTPGTQMGICARVDSAASPTTFILCYQRWAGDTQQVVVEECVSGVYAQLGAYTSAYAAGQVLRLRLEGVVWTLSKLAAAGANGAEGAETRLGSGYTTVVSGTAHGTFSTQSGNLLDNLTITKLDADAYDVPRAYRMTVTKLNRMVLPGYTIQVQYRKVIDGYEVFDIDENMNVLSSTVTIDADGIRTSAMDVSSVRTPVLTDAEYLANELRQARYSRGRVQADQYVHNALTDSSTGVPYAVDVRRGAITNISRIAPVADGTYASVTVTNGVVTAGTS